MKGKEILVSVIVAVRNEKATIDNCLRSIKDQKYSNIEILVVDRDSEDRTVEIAEKYVDHIYNRQPERSAQRNYGIKNAKGEWVLWIDGDMILDQLVVSKCVELVKNQRDIVGITINEKILGTSLLHNLRRFENDLYQDTELASPRFLKRSAVIKAGGFDEDITGGEDWDLRMRLKDYGKTVNLDSRPVEKQLETKLLSEKLSTYVKSKGVESSDYNAVIYHDEAQLSFSKRLQKRRYYAIGYRKYMQKWGKSNPVIMRQLSPFRRNLYILCVNRNYLKVLLHPIKYFSLIMLKGVEFFLSFMFQ